MPRSAALETMLSDAASLDAAVQRLQLDTRQHLQVKLIALVVRFYRKYLRDTLFTARRARVARQLDELTGLKLTPLGKPRDEGHYLSQEEIDTFERDGAFGPFKVLDPDDAKALGDQVKAMHKTDFVENTMLTRELVDAFLEADQFSLDIAGQFQALRVPEFYDLTTHPAIGQRLASLLGDDVQCWRTQFFEKNPGARGTFWHQNSIFREFGDSPKLDPPPGMDIGMANLTVWVALRDVPLEAGALRLVPGSYRDARFEAMYEAARERMIDFLSDVPDASLEDILKIGLFAGTPFDRLRALFEATVDQLGDIFDGLAVEDYPMEAGQALIFTSLNMHASYSNTSKDLTRLAFAGRYNPGSVAAFQGATHEIFSTGAKDIKFPMGHLPVIQVHGTHHGKNRIATPPEGSMGVARWED